MAQWDDGYVTDVAYTASFYREITPAWLAMTSLLLGHRPPDLARPFAYADIGCGHRFNTLTRAASCPPAALLPLPVRTPMSGASISTRRISSSRAVSPAKPNSPMCTSSKPRSPI